MAPSYDDVYEDLKYNRGNNTSTKHLVRTCAWFLLSIKDDHSIPSPCIKQMMGIGSWYMEQGYLTEKQSRWLQIHLIKYEEQIDPMKAYA